MKVRYSRRAANDLESIREYLSEQSVRGAANVLAAVYLAIEFIRRNPEAAEQTAIGDVRAKTVRKYRFKIFYRVLADDDTIEIVHVRHTSRRPWSGADA
jgi:toxin ParE1/3/4